MILRADYLKSPHIGIFLAVNDNHALVPKSCPRELEVMLKEKLDVDVVKASVAQTGLFGIFSIINNKQIIVPNLIDKEEEKTLKQVFSEVIILEERYTAIGNLVAMNDHGIACSPVLGKKLKAIGLKIASTDLIGSAVYANNKAFIAHRDATEEEVKHLEKILKVKGGIGTINFGDPFVKTGIVGNKKGLITGSMTSGPELNRIDDIFTFEKGVEGNDD